MSYSVSDFGVCVDRLVAGDAHNQQIVGGVGASLRTAFDVMGVRTPTDATRPFGFAQVLRPFMGDRSSLDQLRVAFNLCFEGSPFRRFSALQRGCALR